MVERAIHCISVALPHPALDDADWGDCWQVTVSRPFANARAAGEAIVAAFPWWTYPALGLRQIVVMPFGLKGRRDVDPSSEIIGIFPVVSETEHRIIAGLDDTHLDFRIVVDLAETAAGQTVSMTTVIRRHNRFGQGYLAMVMPFHRAIIRGALARLARQRG